MLKLNNLSPSIGARKPKKRVGRGQGSGNGKTAARGHKGARARSGYSASPGFEGGQMPLHRRLPKRGFTNIFKKTYNLVSLEDLSIFHVGSTVDQKSLIAVGLVKKIGPVKILANGDITISLNVRVDKVSESAKEKIVAAGGTVED